MIFVVPFRVFGLYGVAVFAAQELSQQQRLGKHGIIRHIAPNGYGDAGMPPTK